MTTVRVSPLARSSASRSSDSFVARMATAPRLAALAAKSIGMYGPSSSPGLRVAVAQLVAE